jgi:hypothetical protein
MTFRKSYDFMDVMGEVGGVFYNVYIIGGCFFYPYAMHSYYIKAINKLFVVYSPNNNLFSKKKNK